MSAVTKRGKKYRRPQNPSVTIGVSMSDKNSMNAVEQYVRDVKLQFSSGHALEHAYRPALQRLMSGFDDTIAVNDPKRSAHGNPDFIFLKASNKKIIRGYSEAKDIDINLDKIEKTESYRMTISTITRK